MPPATRIMLLRPVCREDLVPRVLPRNFVDQCPYATDELAVGRRSDHPAPEHPRDVEGREVRGRKPCSEHEHPSGLGFVEHPRELVDEIFEGDGTRLRVHWRRILDALGGGRHAWAY